MTDALSAVAVGNIVSISCYPKGNEIKPIPEAENDIVQIKYCKHYSIIQYYTVIPAILESNVIFWQ